MADVKPRKQASQERSRATVAAIREAAVRILATGGLEAVTTNAVAARAGVSVGSLYQYYPNRDAILADLLREKLAALQAAVAAAGEAETLDGALRAMLTALAASYLRAPALAAALSHVETLIGAEPDIARSRAALGAATVGVLRRHGVPDPEVAARDLVAMTRGMALAAGLAGERDADALAARLARVARGYLGR